MSKQKHQGAWDVSFWEQRLSTSQKTPWSLDSLVMVHGCWWLASDLWNIWDDLNSRHGPNCVCKRGSAADSADSASTASYGINPYGSRVSAGIHNAINMKNSLLYDTTKILQASIRYQSIWGIKRSQSFKSSLIFQPRTCLLSVSDDQMWS